MSEAAAPPVDVGAVIRSKDYGRLLLLSAGIGLVVALLAWCFLTLVPWIQNTVFKDIPSALGMDPAPWWWPLPVLAIGGVITALVIMKLPGGGGRAPAEGLGGGITQPKAVPGVIIAGLATLGLGLVLGPSSPVIALGGGMALFLFRLAKKDEPDQVQMVIFAAGSFASFSLVFRSPLVGAIILIEAIGLGGPTLPLVVLPGLLGSAIGSVVYLGMAAFTGLSTEAYAVTQLKLQPMGALTIAEIGWALVIGVAAAVIGFGVVKFGKVTERLAARSPMVAVPVAGVVVAGLAIGYAQITGQPVYAVLFSGSGALDPLVKQSAVLAASTLALLLLFKGAAWSLSLGAFRGGPVFPAIFMGTVLGMLAMHLPGFPMGAAVPAAMAATIAAVLRLPLASVVIALVLCASAGASASPLVIIGMVVSYWITMKLAGLKGRASPAAPAPVTETEAAP